MLVSLEEKQDTSVIRKHVAAVLKNWDGVAIYVTRTIASNARDRLIDYKLPFIVPGNQLYLPDIGLDMREHFRTIRTERQSLSPATQAVIIRALVTSEYDPVDSTLLTNKFHYTPMTFKRIFDEIEHFDIGIVETEGRKRVLRFVIKGNELWKAALPILRSPVKKHELVSKQFCELHGVQAGLTALAHYSMLAPPTPMIYAIGSDHWNNLKQNHSVSVMSAEDPDICELEIWSYSPHLFSQNNCSIVDRFSLYLSLQGNSDERVEAALEEMVETITW